jgi:hypothetical protein
VAEESTGDRTDDSGTTSPTSDENGEPVESGRRSTLTAALETVQLLVAPVYLLLTVVSAAGLAVAAALGVPWLAAISVAVAVLADFATSYPYDAEIRMLDRIGAGPRTRAMLRSLAVAVTFGVVGDDVVLRLYAAVALTAHACWVVFSAVMRRVISTAPSMAITGVGQELELRWFFARARRRRARGPSVLLTLEWFVVAGLWLSGQSRLLAILVTVAGSGAMLAFAAFALWWGERFLHSGRVGRYERQLMAELTAYSPDVIVYMTAAAGQSAYILNQWLPALDRMDKRGIILVREANNITPIAETTLPIIYAPRTRDVERFVLPSVKLALYPANGGRNVHLAREAGIRHIFLNHGDSDKSTSANPVSRLYDEVWVAGQTAIDRYQAADIKIPRENFAIVGRPQVDALRVGPRPDRDQPRVLYAPTFEGHYEEANYSSLEVMGPQMIRAILAERPDIGIIFKHHPSTGMERKSMLTAKAEVARLLVQAPNARQHIIAEQHPEMTLNDCFEMADVLISDISSVVTDFLHTERPVLVSNPMGLPPEEFRAVFPSQAASYIIDPDLTAFLATLDDALGPDSMHDERVAIKRYVLGDLPDGPLQAFCDEIDRAYTDAVAHQARVRNTFTWTDEQLARRSRAQQRVS